MRLTHSATALPLLVALSLPVSALATAGPALAHTETVVALEPTNCLAERDTELPGSYSVLCWGGTGAYRAAASCKSNVDDEVTIVFGRWYSVSSDEWSIAQCPFSHPVFDNGWWET